MEVYRAALVRYEVLLGRTRRDSAAECRIAIEEDIARGWSLVAPKNVSFLFFFPFFLFFFFKSVHRVGVRVCCEDLGAMNNWEEIDWTNMPIYKWFISTQVSQRSTICSAPRSSFSVISGRSV